MTTTIVAVDPVIVQTCTTYPALDADWTTQQQLIWIGGSEPCGQKFGDAQFKNLYGVVKYGSDTAFASQGPAPDTGRTFDGSVPMFFGQFVRLLKKDLSGAITVDGVTYTAFWWGTFVDATEVPEGQSSTDVGGEFDHIALGLPYVLEQIAIQRGFELSANLSSSVAFDPGYCPVFNAEVGGDKYTSTVTWGGNAMPVHNRYNTSAVQWTALDVVKQVLYGHARIDLGLPPHFTSLSTLKWAIAGQTSALDYVVNKLDLDGETVFSALNHLINQRRGLTWNLSVSGVTATINVRSAAQAAIVVGSFTLPAATSTASLDYRGDITLDELQLRYDYQEVCDRIIVKGKQPKVTFSGEFKPTSPQTYGKGWDSSLESSWNPFIDDAKGPQQQMIWRRFPLQSTWNGGQLDEDTTIGLRNVRAYTDPATSSAPDLAAYGVGGYTGARSYLDGASPGASPSSTTLKLLRMMKAQANHALITPGAYVKTDFDAEPIAIVEYVLGGACEDLSGRYHLRIEESPPAIVLGSEPDDALEISNWFAAGIARLIFTVTVEEPVPLMVSWGRDPAEWPRNTPRTKTIRVDDAEQWIILDKTITSCPGVLSYSSGDAVLRDDTDLLRQALALARAWYEFPKIECSWIKRGTLDIASTYKVGTLLTSVIQGDHTTTVNAVITQRRWVRNGDSFDTSYATECMVPDFDQGIIA